MYDETGHSKGFCASCGCLGSPNQHLGAWDSWGSDPSFSLLTFIQVSPRDGPKMGVWASCWWTASFTAAPNAHLTAQGRPYCVPRVDIRSGSVQWDAQTATREKRSGFAHHVGPKMALWRDLTPPGTFTAAPVGTSTAQNSLGRAPGITSGQLRVVVVDSATRGITLVLCSSCFLCGDGSIVM